VSFALPQRASPAGASPAPAKKFKIGNVSTPTASPKPDNFASFIATATNLSKEYTAIKQKLAATKQELAATKQELAATKQELATAQQELEDNAVSTQELTTAKQQLVTTTDALTQELTTAKQELATAQQQLEDNAAPDMAVMRRLEKLEKVVMEPMKVIVAAMGLGDLATAAT
jgi:chromosome segregation ATPase